ncbi:MAG: hypothetical protein R6U61_06235 [Thermoplasmata archaeon]
MNIGIVLILLAVLLSFISITNDIIHSTEEGVIKDGGYYFLDYRDEAVNSTMNIEYVVNQNNTHNNTIENKTAAVNITDEHFNTLHTLNMSADEKKSIDIDNNARYITANFSEGEIHYEHKIVFPYQPYRLLSIPALLMTMMGIVLFYKGKQRLLHEKFGERGMD